ncbi:MAG TPA: sortase, partial [Streptosporangiaceae bacterium]
MMRGGRQAVTALATCVAGLAVIVTGTVALAVAPHLRQPGPTGPAGAHPAARLVTSAAPGASAAPSSGASVAAPVALTIPSIGVSAPLIRLGLTRSGALQVPDRFDVAGWYDRSPRPGAIGPAVIAGHIDSVRGPAVFYRLDLLHSGDQVYVRRADGSVAAFQVTEVRLYLKAHFPTAAVYGAAPGPELRLITCGGT